MFFIYIIATFLSYSLQAQEAIVVKMRLDNPHTGCLVYGNEKIHQFYNRDERKFVKINDPFVRVTVAPEQNSLFDEKIYPIFREKTDNYIPFKVLLTGTSLYFPFKIKNESCFSLPLNYKSKTYIIQFKLETDCPGTPANYLDNFYEKAAWMNDARSYLEKKEVIDVYIDGQHGNKGFFEDNNYRPCSYANQIVQILPYALIFSLGCFLTAMIMRYNKAPGNSLTSQ